MLEVILSKTIRTALTCAVLFSCTAACIAEEIKPTQFLNTYCIKCHGEAKQEGDRRFDQLNEKSLDLKELEHWQEIVDRINLGDMPPKESKQPTGKERVQIAETISKMVRFASRKLDRSTGKTVLRRLNRHEYDRTMRDLLSLEPMLFDPTSEFPPDESSHNFQNIGSELIMSDFLLRKYIEASQQYLENAVFPRTQPKPRSWTFQAPFFRLKARPDGKDRPGQYQHVRKNYHDTGGFLWIKKFEKGVPISGNYKIRIKAAGMDREYPYSEKFVKVPKEDPIRMQVIAGAAKFGELDTNNASDRLLREYELPDNEPEWFEFTTWMDKGYQPRIAYPNGPISVKYIRQKLVQTYPDDFKKYWGGYVPIFNSMHPKYDPKQRARLEKEYLAKIKRLKAQGKKVPSFGISSTINSSSAWAQFFSEYDGPRVRVYEIQLEGPFYDNWPPKPQRKLFGTVRPSDKNSQRLIERFAKQAFRKPVDSQTLSTLNKVYKNEREKGNDPQASILTTYQAVLCSPHFLYLHQNPGKLDDHALASRLSYFLWSSPPDQQLLDLADLKKLNQPEIIQQQVVRMLKDSRAESMVEQFANSWLQLSKLGKMLPSQKAHPEYFNQNLEPSMRKETHLFLKDMLENNLPITNFLDSKETFVNGPLARLYNMGGISGNSFQKVTLQGRPRGGLLGMASVLTATANGIETSPVIRGVWVLENILGTPPSPPPPDVEALEPDIRGAKTIREQLAKHRKVETCNACHKKIDPPGFALESYDEIGRFRSKYYNIRRRNPPPVDPSGQLPTGETFKDILELKPLLLERSDIFAKNLAEKLLIYGTGRMPSLNDKLEMNELAISKPAAKFGLRDLIIKITQSESFRSN